MQNSKAWNESSQLAIKIKNAGENFSGQGYLNDKSFKCIFVGYSVDIWYQENKFHLILSLLALLKLQLRQKKFWFKLRKVLTKKTQHKKRKNLVHGF